MEITGLVRSGGDCNLSPLTAPALIAMMAYNMFWRYRIWGGAEAEGATARVFTF